MKRSREEEGEEESRQVDDEEGEDRRGREERSPPSPPSKRSRVAASAGNKRMFGALMGHLGKAQQKLKADSDVIQKQTSRRQEATLKNFDESHRVAKLQRALSVEQKEKELNLRDTMLLKKLKSNLESKTKAWKTQEDALVNFLVTSTQPRLAWLPKIHSEATKSSLSDRKNSVEEEYAKRVAENAKELANKEESMAESRKKVLESQRLKNEQWEARQRDLVESKRKEKLNEDDAVSQGNSSDDYDDHEEEEEEDILAVLDGRKRKVSTALDESNVSTDATEETVPKDTQAGVSEQDTSGDVKATEEENIEEEQESKNVPEESSPLTSKDASHDFDEEAEKKKLMKSSVVELKSIVKKENIPLLKGKMLKKDYVDVICDARKSKSMEDTMP